MSGTSINTQLGYKILIWILIWVCNFVNFSNLVDVDTSVFNDANECIIAYTKQQLVQWGQPKHVDGRVRLTGWTCSRIRKLGLFNKQKYRGTRGGSEGEIKMGEEPNQPQ